MRLDPETERLLWDLVEAARSVPRPERGGFQFISVEEGNVLRHPGLPGGQLLNVDETDLRDLKWRYFRVSGGGPGQSFVFELENTAFDTYDRAHASGQDPLGVQEQAVLDRVRSDRFAQRYRQTWARWVDAAALLDSDDSTVHLTDVGHRCREALQFFCIELAELHQVRDLDPNTAHTVARLRQIIAERAGRASESVRLALDALVQFWGAVSDLAQRQTHGGQKEGEQLTWEDARRIVLYTALVMDEADRMIRPSGFR